MILITGGTGLIGSHLIYQLLVNDKKIRVLIRKTSNVNMIKKVIGYYAKDADQLFSKIQWTTGDVLDYYSICEALKDVDEVYHCAGYISFNPGDKTRVMQINIEGTANLVNAAIEHNIKKFCHVSSTAALGSQGNGSEITESLSWKPSKNHSAYSISKFKSEMEVWRGIVEGLNAVIVNPSVVLGPGDWDNGSTKLFGQVQKGLKFYTRGITGFVDVKDVVNCMISLVNSDISGERFIISSENLSYHEVLTSIAEALHKSPPGIKVSSSLTEIAWRIERLKHIFTGFKPLITKETARASQAKSYFSNQKVRDALNYEFIPVNQSIMDTANLFLKELA